MYSRKQPTSHQPYSPSFIAPKYSENNFTPPRNTTMIESGNSFLHHKLPPYQRVQYVFSATEYHHINQVLSHQSVQKIILEITYTVSNSSPLGKEMCRT